MALEQVFSCATEDFPSVLRRKGLLSAAPDFGMAATQRPPQTESTTILAFKFAGGVMVAGDRRATSGHTVVYDRADKDRKSVVVGKECRSRWSPYH